MSNQKEDESGLTAADPMAATQAASSSSSGPRQAVVFTDGTMIAERYRIVGLLGRGGMGEVYRASDKLLGVDVALKTIRPRDVGGEAASARFRREIQLARRVTHPNVCRIFDVGIHGEIVFLTMELLEGETLAARIKRDGRMVVEVTRPIVEQMAAALTAAHAQGVIHRDLTAHNVIITAEGRAVITDFGLARAANDSDATVTSDGEMIGSPAYMSPEQVEGAKSFSPATDIYALGVVMFEMVTGRLPFVGETSMATAVMRIREAAPSPRQYAADLPPVWDTVILRCLERSPAARFSTARAVVDALGSGVAHRRTWLRPALLGAAVALATALAFALSRPMGSDRGASEAAAAAKAGARPSVAIFGFANLTGRKEEEFLAAAIAEMLSTEMTAGEQVRAVPAESVARARRELDLPAATSFSAETLTRIRRLINTDFVVSGSYVVMGDAARVRVDVKLQDTRTGETVASVAENGSRDDITGLVTTIGSRLRSRLGVDELSAQERAGARAFLPSSSSAAAAYAEGVAALRVHNCGAARAPLERAVGLDPSFPMARAQLAFTLYCLGYDKRAVEEGKRAVQLAAPMPEEARLFTEARLAEASDDVPRAEKIYQRLFDRFPDNFDYGMRLAELLGRAGSPRARPTLDRLRAMPLPDRDNARIDVVDALLALPDPDKALAAFDRAQAKAEAQGARLVAAEALIGSSRLHRARDELDAALGDATRAKEIYQASGDIDGTLKAMADMVAVDQLLGNDAAVQRVRAEARDLREGMEVSRAYVIFASALAQVLAAQGDINDALDELDEVQRWADSRGNVLDEGRALLTRAQLLQTRGDLRASNETLEKGIELLRESNDRMLGGYYLLMAINRSTQGEFKAAQIALEQAIAINEQIATFGGADMVRAMSFYGQGKLVEAESAARRAVASFEKNAPVALAYASMLLVPILLEQGKVDEARVEFQRVKAAAKVVSGAPATSLVFQSLEALIRAHSGKKEDVALAEKELADVRDRADKLGYAVQRIDAELSLGRVELGHGNAASGRARLQRVVKEAETRGYGFYADMARRTLAQAK
jgi:tetratricopeptide (TPR) repeat protein/TolB-like protein